METPKPLSNTVEHSISLALDFSILLAKAVVSLVVYSIIVFFYLANHTLLIVSHVCLQLYATILVPLGATLRLVLLSTPVRMPSMEHLQTIM